MTPKQRLSGFYLRLLTEGLYHQRISSLIGQDSATIGSAAIPFIGHCKVPKSSARAEDANFDIKIPCHLLRCNKGGRKGFRCFPLSYLEGQGAPQNSFVTNKIVVSIPTAPTKVSMILLSLHLQHWLPALLALYPIQDLYGGPCFSQNGLSMR